MSLRTRFTEYVQACFTGIWIESHEHQDVLSDITQICHDEQSQLARWNIESGLSFADHDGADAATNDPLAAIRSINSLASATVTERYKLDGCGNQSMLPADRVA